MQEKPVEASHHISTNHPVSQSYIYQTPLVHDSPASRTEQHKQPPCSVRGAIPETLRVLPGKTATTPVPADLLKLKISQSLIIYHSFHQSIQIFNSPPVPMLLFKHKNQSIQNTQQTVMRYLPFHCNCYKPHRMPILCLHHSQK